MKLELDHIAVAGEDLGAAVAHVEEALGVPLAAGGEHREMGTHNKLLSLGPGLYLEAIAVNPDAPVPNRPRWFALDSFAGPSRLSNWILRTASLLAALSAAPSASGEAMAFKRGDYAWQMAVPEDGRLPYDGASPALIEWAGEAHPAAALPESGCRLERLEIAHPAAMDLVREFPALLHLERVRLGPGPGFEMRADVQTPHGLRYLR